MCTFLTLNQEWLPNLSDTPVYLSFLLCFSASCVCCRAISCIIGIESTVMKGWRVSLKKFQFLLKLLDEITCDMWNMLVSRSARCVCISFIIDNWLSKCFCSWMIFSSFASYSALVLLSSSIGEEEGEACKRITSGQYEWILWWTITVASQNRICHSVALFADTWGICPKYRFNKQSYTLTCLYAGWHWVIGLSFDYVLISGLRVSQDASFSLPFYYRSFSPHLHPIICIKLTMDMIAAAAGLVFEFLRFGKPG